MNCLQLYVQAWKKAFVFQGRARRTEYVCFNVLNLVVMIVLMIVDGTFGMFSEEMGMGAFSMLFSLAALIPSISVSVRRLHDMNFTGLWLLVSFVPLLNLILALALIFAPGSPGANRFGPDPRAAGGASAEDDRSA